MSTNTRCLKLKIRKPINNTWDEVGKLLWDLRYNSSKVLNFTIQKCYDWMNYQFDYKEKHGVYPKDTEVFGCTQRNSIYRDCSKKFTMLYSGNLTQTVGMGTSRWANDKKDVLSLKKSIPSYKLNCPIYIANQSYNIEATKDGYIINVSLVSSDYAKNVLGNGQTRYCFEIAVEDNSTKTIINRLLTEEYKRGFGQITYDDRKKKWYFIISFSFNGLKEKESSTIMGVDIGIVYPLYIAFNDSLYRYKIKGGEIEQFSKHIQRRKNELLAQGRYCSIGRVGRGVKTRIDPIEFARDRVSNFRNTVNHKYSRFVIDIAIKHNVSVIQMEKLGGISESNTFLKSWPYYDLQQKIEYKAKENGIKVKYIDPYKTSQRCSKCGYIDSENREDQKTFICKECGFETNADYNASRNIATLDIENIIKDKCRELGIKDTRKKNEN